MNQMQNVYAYFFFQHLAPSADTNIYDSIAHDLASLFAADNKGKILQTALAQKLDTTQLDALIATLDIETLRSEDALILSYAKLRHPERHFGIQNEPRLKGLIQFYRFHNLHQESFFSEVTNALSDEQSMFFTSYDTAMKWYLPQYYRAHATMGIVAASPKIHRKMRKQLQTSGYSITPGYGVFSVRKHSSEGDRQMRVFDGSEFRRSSRHLERLSLQPIFHSKCLILSAEDLLCCCYRRIWQKITSCAPFQGLASDIWDLLSLVECCSFSQDALRQILLEDKMTAQVSFIHSFLQSFTGKPLPDSLPTFQNQDDAIRTFFKKESSRIQARYNFLGNRKQSLWTLAAKRMPSVAQWIRRILRR